MQNINIAQLTMIILKIFIIGKKDQIGFQDQIIILNDSFNKKVYINIIYFNIDDIDYWEQRKITIKVSDD